MLNERAVRYKRNVLAIGLAALFVVIRDLPLEQLAFGGVGVCDKSDPTQCIEGDAALVLFILGLSLFYNAVMFNVLRARDEAIWKQTVTTPWGKNGVPPFFENYFGERGGLQENVTVSIEPSGALLFSLSVVLVEAGSTSQVHAPLANAVRDEWNMHLKFNRWLPNLILYPAIFALTGKILDLLLVVDWF